jgi:diguanylate cyclase
LLDDADFVEALDRRLRALGPLASSVTLEVTESATIGHTATAIAALVRFRNLEAKVSIDDYGTGHATLTYLKSFPADEIKIDKSFVTHLLDTSSDQILVRSTIELAHELGFKVVAEGVETNACLQKLGEYNCDIAQGWAIGRPVSAEDFILQFGSPIPKESIFLSMVSFAA